MEKVTYKGYDIVIKHDGYSENPWEAWDGCVPLITKYGRFHKDYSDGDIENFLESYLSYNQIKRHQTRVLEMMGFDADDFRKDYEGEDITDMVTEELSNFIREDIENKVKFCEEFDIKHYSATSRGYSQGDWTDTFFCWTPEFEKITGRDYKSMTDKDFESAFKLFGYWAWGDVYWYEVTDKDGQFIDSCGGFYGDDHRESGILDEAEGSVDYDIKSKRQKHFEQLRTWIKNKVPFQYRTKLEYNV